MLVHSNEDNMCFGVLFALRVGLWLPDRENSTISRMVRLKLTVCVMRVSIGKSINRAMFTAEHITQINMNNWTVKLLEFDLLLHSAQ